MQKSSNFIFKVYLNLKYTCYMSYPNFFRIPLFVGMRPPFDYFKMFNIHCHGIRKVLGRFGKKNSQKHKSRGVNLSNTGVHSGNFILEGVDLSIMGCVQESFSRNLWAETTSILLKNDIRSMWGFHKISKNLGLSYFT